MKFFLLGKRDTYMVVDKLKDDVYRCRLKGYRLGESASAVSCHESLNPNKKLQWVREIHSYLMPKSDHNHWPHNQDNCSIIKGDCLMTLNSFYAL